MPIADSYWALPGRLLAGSYPGAFEPQARDEQLRWLLQQGVTLCLDLTEAGEGNLPPYFHELEALALANGRQVQHQRLSIPDFGVPSVEHMQRILDVLDIALASEHVVYLHCWGGIGRTGTVVGCYLVRCGLEGRAALEQIARWRSGVPSSWKESPETDEQRQFILRWQPGQ